MKRALELVQQDPKEVGATEWTFAKETVLLDAVIKARPEVEVEVQALQVGPLVFVSNPAEYFVQYGLDLKKGSKFPFTFPVELANGCVGYVPTEEAFQRKRWRLRDPVDVLQQPGNHRWTAVCDGGH